MEAAALASDAEVHAGGIGNLQEDGDGADAIDEDDAAPTSGLTRRQGGKGQKPKANIN